MLRILCALCFLALLPTSANAISTSSITNTTCSGDLTASVLDGASFACAGNLTLDGGFVTSDSFINISADGNLFVDNLTFTAPNITFSNLTGMMTIGSGVVINAISTILTANDILIAQGAQINILSSGNINFSSGVEASKNGNLGAGAGAIISVGGAVSQDAGIRDVMLVSGLNRPVTGGTLVLGSGALVNAGAVLNEPLLNVTSVPEPSTYAMMLAGVLGLISFRRSV